MKMGALLAGGLFALGSLFGANIADVNASTSPTGAGDWGDTEDTDIWDRFMVFFVIWGAGIALFYSHRKWKKTGKWPWD